MNFKLRLDPLIVMQKIDDQDVLFSKKTGDFFGLNESAAFMLRQLLNGDFKSAVNQSATAFSVDKTMIENDLLELVNALIEAKLAEKQEF
jgi:hypothetical protein